MNCRNCGKELKENAKFCPKCGTKVGEVSDGGINGGATKKKRYIVIGAIVGIFVIAGIAAYLMIQGNKAKGGMPQGMKMPKTAESKEAADTSDKEKKVTDAPDKEKEAEKTLDKEQDAALRNTVDKYYRGIFREYQQAETNGFSDPAEYPRVNPLLFQQSGDAQPLYYTLQDMSGDGEPELFIAQMEKDGDRENYNIVELYGYGYGSEQQLAVAIDLGIEPIGESYEIGSQARYCICEDHIIREETNSDGSDTTTYYEVLEGSAEIGVKNGAVKDAADEYLKIEEGGLEANPISEKRYKMILKKYPEKTDIDWYKLSDLKLD